MLVFFYPAFVVSTSFSQEEIPFRRWGHNESLSADMNNIMLKMAMVLWVEYTM